jgi:predicted transposase YdaD
MPRQPSLFDRSIKFLARHAPAAFLKLAGAELRDEPFRWEDTSVNLPEFRADQLLAVGGPGAGIQRAFHFEYQLRPARKVLRGWFLKNAAFSAQLDSPVVLVGFYLRRGGRTRFPATYRAEADGLANEFRFETVRLWEHADRIRTGELPELAPLLVLCEDEPRAETLAVERELILGVGGPPRLRSDLLGLALTVASRFFPRHLLETTFREELPMLQEMSIVEEWIAEGEARGEARGKALEAQEFVLLALEKRFGTLPDRVGRQVRSLDEAGCRSLFTRSLDASSLDALGL